MASKSPTQRVREANERAKLAEQREAAAVALAATATKERSDARREADGIREAAEASRAAAKVRENHLRDEVLRLTVENARIRGYLDRVEDSTPVTVTGRYSQQREEYDQRNRHYGMRTHEEAPKPWHHRP
jgi:hypothetical protein